MCHYKTSTFAWSPSASLPLLATGTVAGALDESFSNESQLEIWAPDFLDQDEYDLGGVGQNGPKASVSDHARFNRLAWGYVNSTYSQGVIAAGLENGEFALWDPAKILAGADASESLILRNTNHTGPVRGLDFNPIQTNLLASGGVAGEVYIWDLKDPSKPYTPTPGTKSTKLDEITSVAWNQQVQYVLAGASTTGYTVVWDLRGKREVVALAYGGGAGTLAGHMGGGMAAGGRRGMSDIAWHPDNATRVVTASEDDSSPVIMVWDLRNARAPEKILTGHEKGVLSLSWCKQDADLLLSCGKDNRALCWNPQTSEIIGELPSADNWAFQVDWCPRNPDLLATAFFDGTIGIHNIQSTNEAADDKLPSARPDGADIFSTPGFARSSAGTFSLKQPPKWLRRPVSSSFGFGGKLVSVSNLPSAQGKNQSSVVHIRDVVTEQDFVDRAKALQEAIAGENLKEFAEKKVEQAPSPAWKALLSLFKANSREELVTLLGFSKAEIAARVAEAVDSLKASAARAEVEQEEDITEEKPHEPVVSFAEPERQDAPSDSETAESNEKEPSETVSDTASSRLEDRESTTTVPSLFGEDDGPGTPQLDAGQDFFNTIGQSGGDSLPVHVPHTNYPIDSSVAATIGSGPSSVTSEVMSKSSGFKIYPTEDSENDRLVTKALVLGDFESAVSLCLSSDRFADAILLAARGGPELLQKTQKAYFERRIADQPYLRLFQSIVTNDLADIVQNADLQEWQEIFVVICTFASQEEFASLAEQLGVRLEFQFGLAKAEGDDAESVAKANAFRKNATLTYLAAGRLERLISIWGEELVEDEKALLEQAGDKDSHFSVHASALQSFIEKVTIFRSATNYKDEELNSAPDNFKLANLYDRYLEYADLLTTQGLLKEAAAVLKLTPSGYKGSSPLVDRAAERERLVVATSSKVQLPARAPAASTSAATGYGYTPAAPVGQTRGVPVPPVPAPVSHYNPYQAPTAAAPAPPAQQYGHQAHTGYQPPQAAGGYQPPTQAGPYQQSPYAPVNPAPSFSQPPPPRQPPVGVPPPPRAANGGPPTVPPPPKRDAGGWNDAPPAIPNRPASINVNKNAPAPITSPFPNAAPATPGYSPSGSPYPSQGQVPLPPPPRPGSVQGRGAPVPPPPQGARVVHPPPAGQFPPQARPPSRTAAPPVAPPSRIMSPGGGNAGPPRLPTPSQYAPPPRGPSAGPYGAPQGQQQQHPPPPPGHGGPQHAPGPYGPPQGGPAQANNPYGPPQDGPAQANNPYAPPPGAQQHQQPPPPPPHSAGAYAPPPRPLSSQQQPHHGMPPQAGGPPPPGGPPPGGPAGAPPRAASVNPPARQGPPPPKYPPGDRSHIPDHVKPAYEIILENLNRMKQSTPPSQKRLVDDLERRINPLFDALNCETLSQPVVEQLIVLTRAMEARDRPAALAIHVDLLTRGSQTDDIGLWMSGIKQLIMRL
ncbi:structural molecule [Coprinopsis cinerea okayama7|uniref:Protein transport protein SEC31 n=1 Tax=Coprinopsis cinerea (strain Okayama-7 / 130 / ATCC MYA-4618 / FGSC 9003) TaxID=240176 RepID=A8P512_COPC7|nr:structural molecule [Coprinopsis cinerea okayama7\|eukprot:XP_001838855.2 structural molecule [Coprinopsis cinerea okayama7\